MEKEYSQKLENLAKKTIQKIVNADKQKIFKEETNKSDTQTIASMNMFSQTKHKNNL